MLLPNGTLSAFALLRLLAQYFHQVPRYNNTTYAGSSLITPYILGTSEGED